MSIAQAHLSQNRPPCILDKPVMSKLNVRYKISQEFLQTFSRDVFKGKAMLSEVLKFDFARTHIHIVSLFYLSMSARPSCVEFITVIIVEILMVIIITLSLLLDQGRSQHH